MKSALLHRLSHELECGRPVWALIQANQWLPANHPLRRAIAKQSLEKCSDNLPETLVSSLVDGKRFIDLSPDEQQIVRDHRESPSQRRQIPSEERFSLTAREMRLGRNLQSVGKRQGVSRRQIGIGR